MSSVMDTGRERRYVVEGYDRRSPFASFLPGIAGPDGVPLWCFYVNRGQGVACFGHTHKNNPIMEFKPADQAYRETPRLGFRTFVRSSSGTVYEPFCPPDPGGSVRRTMSVGRADFALSEESDALGFQVRYAGLPGEGYPALLRCLEVSNRSDAAVSVEILDGLPRVIPFGISDHLLKTMSNTASAWIATDMSEPERPRFRIRASIEDSVEVRPVNSSHFVAAVGCFGGDASGDHPLPIVVDVASIFGPYLSLDHPTSFATGGLAEVLAEAPVLLGRYPSAFAGVGERELPPGGTIRIYSIFGYAPDGVDLTGEYGKWHSTSWFEAKFEEYARSVEECVSPFRMSTGLPDLDAYTAQTALDNTLRGGMPLVWGAGEERRTFHIYSRKHGDMERDYNDFSLDASRYSTGFGNYRDMNQNRRMDVAVYPEVGTSVIRLFMELVQPDGYNPLIVKGGGFLVREEERKAIAARFPRLAVEGAVTPGDLAAAGVPEGEFAAIFAASDYQPEADFGEGYWIDHWTYNLDLVEHYLRIFPDREERLFFGEPGYRWYFSGGIRVRPLNRRFRRRGGTIEREEHLEEEYRGSCFLEHTSTLAEKLCVLALVKCATLGYSERGLEMEAGRPGWYDALNGLPGHFGSSLSDSAELLRLLRLLVGLFESWPERSVRLFSAAWQLLDGLCELEGCSDPHERWLKRWELRDAYRGSFSSTSDGAPTELRPVESLAEFFSRQERGLKGRLNEAIQENGGIMPTYYLHEPAGWVDADEGHCVPSGLVRKDLPLFLEGTVKQMKLTSSPVEKLKIHWSVKSSVLYDRSLGMYVLNAPLDEQPDSIGRAKVFPSGWLENGSVWLHMEYKYLLELLRAGDGETFWKEANTALIPFIDRDRYGRSPYENSSFIASSSYPVASCHGRGFVGRLSGATAEYLSIWQEFLVGRNPFRVEGGRLVFRPSPCIPVKLFRSDSRLEFVLFGRVEVCYENPDRIDLFGGAYRIDEIVLTEGTETRTFDGELPEDEVVKLRKGDIGRMVVVFACSG